MIGASRVGRIISITPASLKFFLTNMVQNLRNIYPRNAIMQSFFYDLAMKGFTDVSLRIVYIRYHEKYKHTGENLINVKLTKCRIANFNIRDSI
jgi:plasmid rolling circle replication initiator protein Rep